MKNLLPTACCNLPSVQCTGLVLCIPAAKGHDNCHRPLLEHVNSQRLSIARNIRAEKSSCQTSSWLPVFSDATAVEFETDWCRTEAIDAARNGSVSRRLERMRMADLRRPSCVAFFEIARYRRSISLLFRVSALLRSVNVQSCAQTV